MVLPYADMIVKGAFIGQERLDAACKEERARPSFSKSS